MFTRCPECHAVYPLRASWLAQDRGKMECGRCGKFFNSLSMLFDDWPEPDETPTPPLDPNQPFHLSHRYQEETETSNAHKDSEAASESTDPAQLELLKPNSYQWLWNGSLILIIPLTIANFT